MSTSVTVSLVFGVPLSKEDVKKAEESDGEDLGCMIEDGILFTKESLAEVFSERLFEFKPLVKITDEKVVSYRARIWEFCDEYRLFSGKRGNYPTGNWLIITTNY